MVRFSIPVNDRFFSFNVDNGRVMFAGSRYGRVDPRITTGLISAFGGLGFSFLTGCASGVDKAFRDALSTSDYTEQTIVACAFQHKIDNLKGIFSLFVVPQGLPPRVALAKRTLWLTSRCSILILFPSDPIGRGSRLKYKRCLAFKSAICNNKPVFAVTSTKPDQSSLYSVLHSNLFGLVEGYWCIPPVYQDTGLCYEAV
jgi:hypothetical protein